MSVGGGVVVGYVAGHQTREAVSEASAARLQASEEKPKAAISSGPVANRTEEKESEAKGILPVAGRLSGRELKRRSEQMRTLAMRDPRGALESAKREKNGYVREQLLQAALSGWAGTAPEQALAWAKSQPLSLRADYISYAIKGAAETDPSAAIRLATTAMTEDPEKVNRFAQDLVNSLVEVGEFEAALRFVLPGSSEWEARLSTCYRSWALHSPEDALAAANGISEPALKSVALQNVVASWSMTDPTKALAFVESLPQGAQRQEGFTAALQQWATRDPLAVLDWIDRHPPSADTRDAASALALLPTLSPQAALGWSDLIGDPALRANARELAVFRWAAEDASAARRYIETSPNLSPEERVRLTLQLSSATSS